MVWPSGENIGEGASSFSGERSSVPVAVYQRRTSAWLASACVPARDGHELAIGRGGKLRVIDLHACQLAWTVRMGSDGDVGRLDGGVDSFERHQLMETFPGGGFILLA